MRCYATKAYEFQTKVTSEGKLVVEVPNAFFEKLQRYEEEAWARLTAEQFLAGYNDTDAVYDTLFLF